MSLTRKQQAFIREYCSDPKSGQAQAAMRAGYSPMRAKETAMELMKHPEVREAIQSRLERRMDQALARPAAKLTPEVVLYELDQIAAAAVEAGSGTWQAATRLKVAELKGKYLGMWKEKVEFGLDEELIKRLEESRKRAFLPAEPKEANEQPSGQSEITTR
jgi:phage terminase small subunit